MVRLVLVSVLLLGLVAMATASRSGPHAAKQWTHIVCRKQGIKSTARTAGRARPSDEYYTNKWRKGTLYIIVVCLLLRVVHAYMQRSVLWLITLSTINACIHASLPPSKAVLSTSQRNIIRPIFLQWAHWSTMNECWLTRNHAGPYEDDVIRRNLLQAASTSSNAATSGMMITSE